MKQSLTAAAIGLMSMAVSTPASASESKDTYSFIFENDLFYHTDRDYTNGVELSWSPSEPASGTLPDFISSLIPQPFAQGDRRASYSVGQLMFTPEDTNLIDPPITERPYAGYLYGAYALTNSVDSRQDVLRIQLGMVGPASLAQDSQIFIHRLRGFALPQGWHTQLRDEPGLIVSYQRTQDILSAMLGGRVVTTSGRILAVLSEMYSITRMPVRSRDLVSTCPRTAGRRRSGPPCRDRISMNPKPDRAPTYLSGSRGGR